jgi:hypothetical protein
MDHLRIYKPGEDGGLDLGMYETEDDAALSSVSKRLEQLAHVTDPTEQDLWQMEDTLTEAEYAEAGVKPSVVAKMTRLELQDLQAVISTYLKNVAYEDEGHKQRMFKILQNLQFDIQNRIEEFTTPRTTVPEDKIAAIRRDLRQSLWVDPNKARRNVVA